MFSVGASRREVFKDPVEVGGGVEVSNRLWKLAARKLEPEIYRGESENTCGNTGSTFAHTRGRDKSKVTFHSSDSHLHTLLIVRSLGMRTNITHGLIRVEMELTCCVFHPAAKGECVDVGSVG